MTAVAVISIAIRACALAFVFALLFLGLLLSAGRAGAISSAHLRMLSSHLWIPRHLIHRVRLASTTSGSGHFAGVHFRFVSAHFSPVALFSVFRLVSVFSCVSSSAFFPSSSPLTFPFVP